MKTIIPNTWYRCDRAAPLSGGRLWLVVPVVTLLVGCQEALFPQNQPRTQFELQDQMRGRYVPLEQPDVFGQPQPNLRGRLAHQD